MEGLLLTLQVGILNLQFDYLVCDIIHTNKQMFIPNVSMICLALPVGSHIHIFGHEIYATDRGFTFS